LFRRGKHLWKIQQKGAHLGKILIPKKTFGLSAYYPIVLIMMRSLECALKCGQGVEEINVRNITTEGHKSAVLS